MPIIHRYSASSEFSDLLTTKPLGLRAQAQLEPASSESWISKQTKHLDFSTEKEAWKNALPSAEELQKISLRILADPELSQTRFFNFCAPLFVFFCLIAVGVVVPRNRELQEKALRLLGDLVNGNNKGEIAFVVATFSAATLGGLVVLRVIIWGIAMALTFFSEHDMSNSPSSEYRLTQANAIMGGLL